ncbi:uncharacterized protein [Triticum aestivum]|uniref:uncharacterized protein n=1 Tax=Triticum aestivum TaxID=4565 RepID=UPI001D035D74|nr:uncharacterized protein LOC123115396 [Triticum aestivum]
MGRRGGGGGGGFRSAPRVRTLPTKPAPKAPAPVPASAGGHNNVISALAYNIVDGITWGAGNAMGHRFVEFFAGPRTIQVASSEPQAATQAGRSGSKTGRSGLQYWARENVCPVRVLTEPLGRTEKTQSPPSPFVVVAPTGSPTVNHHVPEVPLPFLPLLPVRRILLPPVAIAVLHELPLFWSSRTWPQTQRWH